MRNRLKTILENTLEDCFRQGALQETALPPYVIEVPANSAHGHFATNLPLTLASSQRRNPREIAGIVVDRLVGGQGFVEKAEVAGPGFVNFTISREQWFGTLVGIVDLDADYGRSDLGRGGKVLLEYVSANPTGPLHLGHGRGAALGDTLSRILTFSGYDVVREFYVNDAGEQIRLLGASIYSRWRQLEDPDYPFPENGYHGEYISELAREVSRETDLKEWGIEEAICQCAQWGKSRMLEEIAADLAGFRTDFDAWFRESGLHDSGQLHRALADLEAQGQVYEKDGALWIRTSGFGDDKDRVVRKTDGRYTYFASDISYHLEKQKRGFSRAINIWGADHHGYVGRVQAALKSRGIEDSWLTVLLIQLVKLWKGGREIKMSKRAGRYVTLKELVEEVGVDAARFVFLTKNHDSSLDFDIDILKKQDSDNPVYYVQYAHARICSVFRKAAQEGLTPPGEAGGVLEKLKLDEELKIIRSMAEFPPLLEEIAGNLEPHRLTYYLTDLASSFHRYFNLGTQEPRHRILTADKELSQARLLLIQAIRVVLRNGLDLLGINAPERM